MAFPLSRTRSETGARTLSGSFLTAGLEMLPAFFATLTLVPARSAPMGLWQTAASAPPATRRDMLK